MSDRKSSKHRNENRSRRHKHNDKQNRNLKKEMKAILSRLNSLEKCQHVTAPINTDNESILSSQTPLTTPPPLGETSLDLGVNATDKIVDAIRSINTTVRSQNFYISNFDPTLHDIQVWCEEVDRAKVINNWTDNECLSRIGHCLKGDARIWLNEWVTNDRSWSNFKREFKPLCPKNVDVANILFNVMKTTSDDYSTYADYARRSLLRLHIVKGLSDELISAIIIRGITDPQIRASATNAKLKPNDLVEYFSIYVNANHSKNYIANSRTSHADIAKNYNIKKRRYEEGKCFSCGKIGHKSVSCTNRINIDHNEKSSTGVLSSNIKEQFLQFKDSCSFCKKSGHKVENCFAKLKTESQNKTEVNFCHEIKGSYSKDIVVAVIHGIPVDVLIDSGSTISLISSSLLKHFNCERKPAFRVLRGIGSQEIESTCYVTLLIEFSRVTLEIDLFVVSPESMNTPVIVGTDVLNRKGVKYIRTRDEQYLVYDNENRAQVLMVEFDGHDPVNTDLVDNDRFRLNEIITEFSDYFISGTATSTVKTGFMHIKLNSDTIIHYRPYRLSYDEKLRVRQIVKDLLDKGIIRESESEFASPILLVKKKDGSDRMCVDFRKLNEITIKDRFPLPLIDDYIDRLGHSKYYTSLDMATGFHQIPMHEDSIHMTGFVTPEGHFEYVKMPYGLANAPVVYQRIIMNTLRSFVESGKVLIYIDDVLIPTMTIEEGFNILREVLQALTAAGFSINLKKCTFLSTEIEYLGRNISNGQVRPSKYKVKALIESPVPRNVKQVRQFLGLAGYFRRYIPGYATKIACIANLTRKDVHFNWGEEQEQVRREIIEHLTNEPVLAIYNPKLPIEVHTDASSIGYGAVLLQVYKSGHKRVIAYFSRLTQAAEPKYHSYELETLAVVKALQHFRHYLVGIKFTVVTDCNALKLTQRKKDLLPRVARWWTYLQDFDFELEYRKGVQMLHVDYLSRNPVNVCCVQKPKNWAQIAQAADEETQNLIQKLNEGKLDCNRYVKKNDLLYYKYMPIGEEARFLCFIPKGHRLSLLRVFHDEHDHLGVDKTIDLILKHFWFPGLRMFVQKYISHCLICISHKKVPRAPLQPIHSWEKPDNPFETIHVDALGPLPDSNGYKYVFIVVDAFSKFCLLYPMYRQDTDELKRLITNTISLFGTPKLIVADRGRMFQSSEFLNWIKSFGCDTHFITPEMHQANGQVERYCRTVLNMIRIESNYRQNKWSDIIWKLQLILNITKHKVTARSPLNLLIGVDAATPLIRSLIRDVALEGTQPNQQALREISRQRASARLKTNKEKQDTYVNSDRSAAQSFPLNSLVFVIKKAQMTGKLDAGMRGPYRVINVLPNDRYELQLMAGSLGKTTQAAAEYMVQWRGEWTPETCAAYFESKPTLYFV